MLIGDKIQGFIESIHFLSYSHIIGLCRQLPNFRRYIWGHRVKPNVGDLMNKDADALTYAILERVMTLLREKNMRAVALYVDNIGARESEQDKKRREKIHQMWRKYDVTFVDIPSKRDRPDIYYKIDSHWNVPGHELVAKQVLSLLTPEEKHIKPL